MRQQTQKELNTLINRLDDLQSGIEYDLQAIVKDMEVEIEELKTENTALEDEIDELKDKIAELERVENETK